MAKIRFLHGRNLNDSINIVPGTFYLDLATRELWYDDPADTSSTQHNKIIDIETLVYTVDEDTITWDPGAADNSGTSAKLGVAILGKMVLGAS